MHLCPGYFIFCVLGRVSKPRRQLFVSVGCTGSTFIWTSSQGGPWCDYHWKLEAQTPVCRRCLSLLQLPQGPSSRPAQWNKKTVMQFLKWPLELRSPPSILYEVISMGGEVLNLFIKIVWRAVCGATASQGTAKYVSESVTTVQNEMSG